MAAITSARPYGSARGGMSAPIRKQISASTPRSAALLPWTCDGLGVDTGWPAWGAQVQGPSGLGGAHLPAADAAHRLHNVRRCTA